MWVELIGKTVYQYDDGEYDTAESLCDEAAAICTNYDGEANRALKGALSCGHESVIEHANYTFRVSGVSRVLLAQLTRHRLASFSVESQRYVNQGERSCIVPPSMAKDDQVLQLIHICGKVYDQLVAHGVPIEDARYILPMGGQTQFIMTMNARELRHFLSLRHCNRAQWEIRELAEKMLAILKEEAPILFGNAGAGCVRGKCPEGKKSCGKPRTM